MATAEPCQLPAVGLCKAPAALRRLMEPKNLAHFFKCMDSGCSFSSDDDDLFLVHLSAHRDQAPLCVYCGHLATSAARLVKHMVTAHSLRKAQCSLCLYRARTKMHLIVHAAVAHEGTVMSWYSCRDITPPVEKPISPGDVTELFYQCANAQMFPRLQTCRFLCLTMETFHKHLRENHSGQKWFYCHLCKERASCPKGLMEHYACAHSFQTVQCLHCDFGHASEWKLLKHVMEEHADEPFRLLHRGGRAPIICDMLKVLSAKLLSRSILTGGPKQSEALETTPQVTLSPGSMSRASTSQLTESGLLGCDMPSLGGTSPRDRTKHFPTLTEFDKHMLGECSAKRGVSGHSRADKEDIFQGLLDKEEIPDVPSSVPEHQLLPFKEVSKLHRDDSQELESLQQGPPTFPVNSVDSGVFTDELRKHGLKNSPPRTNGYAGGANAIRNVAEATKMDPAIPPAEAGIKRAPELALGHCCVEHYVCALCGKHRMDKMGYCQHMSSRHGMKFFCGHCEKAYKVAKAVLAHLQRHHLEQPRSMKKYRSGRLLDVTPHMVDAWERRWQGRSRKNRKQTRQLSGPPPEKTREKVALTKGWTSPTSCSRNVDNVRIPADVPPRNGCSSSLQNPAKSHANQSLSPVCQRSEYSLLGQTARRDHPKKTHPNFFIAHDSMNRPPSDLQEKSVGITPGQLPALEMVAQSPIAQPALEDASYSPGAPITILGQKTPPEACSAPNSKGLEDLAVPSCNGQGKTKPDATLVKPSQSRIARKSSSGNGRFLRSRKPSCEAVIPTSDSEVDRYAASCDALLEWDSEDGVTSTRCQKIRGNPPEQTAKSGLSEKTHQTLLSAHDSVNHLPSHFQNSVGITQGQLPAFQGVDQSPIIQPALEDANCSPGAPISRLGQKTPLEACPAPNSKGPGDLARPSGNGQGKTKPDATLVKPSQSRIAGKSSSGNCRLLSSRKLHRKKLSREAVILTSDSKVDRDAASCDAVLKDGSEDGVTSTRHQKTKGNPPGQTAKRDLSEKTHQTLLSAHDPVDHLPSHFQENSVGITPGLFPAVEMVDQSPIKQPALEDANCSPGAPISRLGQKTPPEAYPAPNSKGPGDLAGPSVNGQGKTKPDTALVKPGQSRVARKSLSGNGRFLRSRKLHGKRSSSEAAIHITDSNVDTDAALHDAVQERYSEDEDEGQTAKRDLSKKSDQNMFSACDSRSCLPLGVQEKSPRIIPGQLPAHAAVDQSTVVHPDSEDPNCCPEGTSQTSRAISRVGKRMLPNNLSAPKSKAAGELTGPSSIGQSQMEPQPIVALPNERRVARKSLSGNGLFIRSRKLCNKNSSCPAVVLISDSEDDTDALSQEVVVLNSDSEDEVTATTSNGFSYYRMKPQPLDYSRLFVWDSDSRVPYFAFTAVHKFQPRLLVHRLCFADLVR